MQIFTLRQELLPTYLHTKPRFVEIHSITSFSPEPALHSQRHRHQKNANQPQSVPGTSPSCIWRPHRTLGRHRNPSPSTHEIRSPRPTMIFAGGAASVQDQTLEYGITPDDDAQAARGTAGYLGSIASAAVDRGRRNPNMVDRGRRNPNMAQHGNPDAVRLGEEVGVFVMGQAEWYVFITSPSDEMGRLNRPSGRN